MKNAHNRKVETRTRIQNSHFCIGILCRTESERGVVHNLLRSWQRLSWHGGVLLDAIVALSSFKPAETFVAAMASAAPL